MSVFRRRRGHPFGFIATLIGSFFFTDDAEQDQYFTDDAFLDPLIYEDE